MDVPVLADQRTYFHQVCADTGCSWGSLSRAMNHRDGWIENQGNMCCQQDLMMMILSLRNKLIKEILKRFTRDKHGGKYLCIILNSNYETSTKKKYAEITGKKKDTF